MNHVRLNNLRANQLDSRALEADNHAPGRALTATASPEETLP
jgi:hypothetical protein